MNMSFTKLFSALTALLASITGLSAYHIIPNSRYAGKLDARPVRLPRHVTIPANEMRGVWVATIFNLDYPRAANTAEFKKNYTNMCRNLAGSGFNAIFFQVRPANDAFYPSKLNPWSRYLSGTEGVALSGERNFDPLRFMINEAHRHNLQFHAWLNPYRVTGGTQLTKYQYLRTLAPNNFARRHPELVLEVSEGSQRKLILNPSSPQVRSFVAATVMEIVKNYPVDSIHFDDYFYPDNMPFSVDRADYRRMNQYNLPQDAWRRHNVTTLIYNVHEQIKRFNRQHRRQVKFGVSPFGIWRNKSKNPAGSLTAGNESYTCHYADTRLWVKQRMIDYIVPQLYWHMNHDVAAYAALADWWSATVRGTGVILYTGNAAYQLGKSQWSNRELYYQLTYNRTHPEIKGSIIFSYRNLAHPENQTMLYGGRQMLKHLWKK